MLSFQLHLPDPAPGASVPGTWDRVLAQASLPPCVWPLEPANQSPGCLHHPQSPDPAAQILPLLIKNAPLFGGLHMLPVPDTHVSMCLFPDNTPSIFWVGVVLKVPPCPRGNIRDA